MKRLASFFFATILLVGCSNLYVSQEQVANLQAGMTEQQVVERLGKPIDINVTRREGYEQAQYVYSMGQYQRAYVYFENGELSSVQY